jgi:diguanylate cyclase (GGDEF)-like protein/PAS domain S-box-containing protein
MQYKIAIIDDNPDDIFAIKKMLLKQNSEYIVVDFTNTEEALEELRQDTVDCIILDYNFPAMNGLEFITEFRSNQKIDTPIIVLTGQGNEKVAVESIKTGAFDYIIKSEISGGLLNKSIIKGIQKRDFDSKEKSHNEFIKTMVEIIPVPLFYKDRKGSYLGCNKAFEEFIGKSKEEIIGKTVYEISKKNNAQTYEDMDQQLFDNPGTQTYEYEYENSHNEKKYVVFNKVTYNNSSGDVNGIIGIVNDITEIKKRETELKEKTFFDSLTGIFNRRYLDENVENEWKKCVRENAPLSLIMLDIDFFKKYNDYYGHQAGDDCLKKVAQEIRISLLRPSDIAVRYGGEEFVVILPNTKIHGAHRVAERIRRNIINLAIQHEASTVSEVVTLSQGIAEMNHKDDTVNECLKKADKSLYEAKNNGRNTIRIWA